MVQIDQTRIRNILTYEGSIPEGYAFLVDDVIYVWNPAAHFQRLHIHDMRLVSAIREHLTKHARVYTTLQHATDTIIAEQWQNWHKLLVSE